MRLQSLMVAMNGEEIGTLYRDGDGAMSFQYATSWLQDVDARPISLSLPLRSERHRGTAVFNFFQNLLPDSDAILTRMQTRFQVATTHPFDLLAAIGRDCVGAIQLYPANSQLPPVTSMTATPLTESQIAALLAGYQTAPLGMTEHNDFRISLAGAQEKTALLWFQGRWQQPLGSSATSHIFKLPIGRLEHHNIDLSDSCENEWLCLQIAKAFGFEAANAELATFGDKKVLIVERFDRRWSQNGQWLMRLPQEDFCQAMGIAPALKYQADGGPGVADSMKLLMGSRLASADRETFFRTQILFWLLAAIDGHGKNFSLFIEAGSSYRLTPIYDVLSAFPLFASGGIQEKKAKMAMALEGKNRQYHVSMIQPRHFISTAEKIGFSVPKTIEMMQQMADATEQVITLVRANLPAGFPESISNAIFDGLNGQADKIKRALGLAS
ncbi:type II toxin-antitoxin system HipA family toxin [Rheinheimera tilapiae]|jgi:serine/threonine-protein kinase HipA|uniref:Type II toxin-antitoxin system HipA family toxin n=1 Tax=Rheinheimera tilapiae TaxID=875043 RepID=A0ABV6BB06_9GAMM